MVLVFGEIFRLGGLRPNIVRQGNKLYEMVIEKRDVVNTTIFRDTYVFHYVEEHYVISLTSLSYV